jgi:leucyl aminopeptidase
LFLAEFVGDVPWAHIDIAGTAWNERDESWRRAGASGFGTRLLSELAAQFVPPQQRAPERSEQ